MKRSGDLTEAGPADTNINTRPITHWFDNKLRQIYIVAETLEDLTLKPVVQGKPVVEDCNDQPWQFQ